MILDRIIRRMQLTRSTRNRTSRRTSFLSEIGRPIQTRRLLPERLEDRRLLAIFTENIPFWSDLGSSPMISAGSVSDPNNPASGAVEDVAIDPNNPAHIFLATVNGGIWRTTNGNRPFNGVDDDGANGVDDAAEQPSWEPLTDDFASLSMSGIAFSPLDASGNTVFAGSGSASSLSTNGGLPIGVFRTTDGGDNWSVFPVNPGGTEPRIKVVLPTTFDGNAGQAGVQQVVLVGTASNTGLYRSINAGQTYTAISGTNGLPTGAVTDIIGDPNNASRFFAGVVGQGVFRSDDGGANWTNTGNLANIGGSTSIHLTAHPGGGTTVLYTIVSGPNPIVFTSNNLGGMWTGLAALPAGFTSGFNNLYTNRASDQITVDPTNSQIVYVAKGYGGSPFLLRYNPGVPSWVQIEDGGGFAAGNTRPHVDSRDLLFAGTNVLVHTNDGGIYFLRDPQNAAANRWTSLHGIGGGGLGVTEYHNVAWDSRFNVATGGAQDNGTSVQNATFDQVWTSYRGKDGGDVQVDTVNAGAGRVFRYSGTQDFELTRHTFDSATNEPIASVALVPGGGLAGFTNHFVPQYELNAVNPARLVTGGSGKNSVYELLNAATAPNAAGATWQAVPLGANFGSVNDTNGTSFAYGGRLGGVDNEEVLVMGSGSRVFVRSTAGGTLTATPTAFPGGTVQDIVLDPENWRHFFVTDGTGVYETPNAGTNWTNLSRNVDLVNTRLQSIEFLPTAVGGVVVVGGNYGVSRLPLNLPDAQWTRLGDSLPNALVEELDFNAADNLLLAGTFGRGADSLSNATIVAQNGGVLNVCGDENQTNQDDLIRIVRDALNPLLVNVFLNNPGPVPSFTIALALLEHINVFGQGGNDNLIVDSSNGLIIVPNGIRYNGDGVCPGRQSDGDSGFDTLTLQQTGGNQTSDTLSVGATVGSGLSTIVGDGGTQSVFFESLEPIVDNVPAPTLTIDDGVVGTLINASNAINYATSDLFGATWGKVTIDAFEPIHFTNKTNLVIDAGAGSDEINLNNPNIPTGLTGTITVNGGDPTASDVLIVNGEAGALDNLRHNPTGVGAGNVVNDDNAQPDVNFTGIEQLTLVVQQADGDGVRLEGTIGNDAIEFFHGVTSDRGTFVGTMDQNNATGVGPFTMTPTNYRGINPQANDSDVGFFNPGGTDSFVFNGTAFNDTISVGLGEAGGREFRNTLNGIIVARPEVFNIASAIVRGLDGDDTFNHSAIGTVAVSYEGGDPGASDVLSFTGTGAGAVSLDLAAATITQTGLGAVSYSGIETVNVDANAALTVTGTPFNDTITATPQNSDNDGRFTHDRTTGVVFNYTDASTITFAGGTGGDDVLAVLGDEAADAVTSGASIVRVDGSTVTVGAGIDELNVSGFGGDDTILLTNFTTPSRIVINGGDGNDTISGSPQNDVIYAGRGNDVINGLAGNDIAEGGSGDDTFTGGTGADQWFGGDDADTFIWDPGDGSDLVEGGTGIDTMAFNGSTANEIFTMNSDYARLEFLRNVGNIDMDVASVEEVSVNRDTTFTATLDQAQEVPAPVAVPGASGNATVRFNSANNTIDVDLFVTGLSGTINASHFHVGAPGVAGPVLINLGGQATYIPDGTGFRRIARGLPVPLVNVADLLAGNFYLNAHTTLNPGGEIRGQVLAAGSQAIGSDTFLVNDLATTDVRVIGLNLGTDAAANAIDAATVSGRTVSDNLQASETGGVVAVRGLSYDVLVRNAVAAAPNTDRLTLSGSDGDDTLKASAGVEATILITLNGDAGNDLLSADAILNGGPGNDTLVGGAGADTYNGNDGDDTLVISSGADTMSGGAGFDVVWYQGTAADNALNLSQTGNSITVSGLITGTIDVSAADLERIDVLAEAGNDISLLSGLTIPTVFDGAAGNDIVNATGVTAATAVLTLKGGPGNDHFRGGNAADLIDGGPGDDTGIGGPGADTFLGGDDADTFIWDPGDGNDLVEGGTGVDTLAFNGSSANEIFTMNSDYARLEFLRNVGNIDLDVASVEEVSVNRDTTFTATLDQAQEVPAPVAVPGANGTATVRFNSVNNTVDVDLFVTGLSGTINASHFHVGAPGVPGPVILNLGGQAGYIPDGAGFRRVVRGLAFPAANIADLLAGNVYLNVHTALNPGGEIRGQVLVAGTQATGSDTFVVNDLATTDVRIVGLNLGTDGAAAADAVNVTGRTVSDDIEATQAAGVVSVRGLSYDVQIRNAVAAQTDRLTISGSDGNDTIKAAAGLEATILITLNGDVGNDVLSADAILNGGPGNDTLIGGAGADTYNGNDGDDTLVVSDGADIMSGGAGFDIIRYEGTNANDTLSLSQAGTTITVTGLHTGTIDVSAADLERIDVIARDGDDTSVLAGLAIPVLYEGGIGNDIANGNTTTAVMSIYGGDGNDTLTGGSADDLIIAGSGNDQLIGGGGVDQEYGEDGNDRFGDASLTGNGVADDPGADFLFGGDGIDQFVWEPGDGSDVVQGGVDAADILRFIGSAAANAFILQPNAAAPTHFNITLAPATVDTHGVEQIILSALGGADTITVNDLTTTEIEAVNLDLGAADAAIDAVVVDGRAADDNLLVSLNAGTIKVAGLEYDVQIINSAVANDSLTVNGNEGNDTIKVDPPVEAGINIILNGNDGNDFLSADAILNGGDGNDTLVGGAGPDTYNGGAGDDILVVSDGADIMNGDAGFDIVLYQGTNASETLSLSQAANIVTVAGVHTGTIDISGAPTVERFDIIGLQGNDTITLTGLTIESRVEAGEGNDTVTLTTLTSAVSTVFGGLGNDTIDASATTNATTRITMYGEDGNDSLIGADQGGANAGDFLYGGTGDDRLEGGTGQDQFFGGDDNDLLVWVAGDGSDLMEGGAGAADQLQFIGSAGANRMELFGGGSFGATGNPAPNVFLAGTLLNPSRAIFALTSTALDTAAVFLNMGDVESVRVDALGGSDEVTVNNQVDTASVQGGFIQPGTDLAHTSITSVVIDLGAADAARDDVNVHGQLIGDNIEITVQDTNANGTADRVDVAGLTYGVSILNSAAVIAGTTVNVAASDRLTVDGNTGNDNIKALAGVENLIGITLNGDAGDDNLSADAIINGGAGDDFLEGGPLDDTINGNAGEDTMIGLGGNDTFDGGADFDSILIPGTSGNDRIDVNQTAPTTLVHTVNGAIETDTLVLVAGVRTVERALIRAGDGDDIIRVQWDDGIGQTAVVDSLRMDVEGGDDFTRDRLAVVDTGTGDLTLYRKGEDDSTGSMTVGPAEDEPLEAVFQEIEYAEPVVGTDGRVIVFKHDPFEFNNSRFLATHLGANDVINVDPTIDPGADAAFGLPSDQDFYRFEAEVTGTLDLQVFFEELPTLVSGRAGLPGDGNLDIRALDLDGTVIAGTGAFGDDDPTNQNNVNLDGDAFREDERIRIPVVQGQTYYLQVFGVGAAINAYNITVINEASPIPFDLELDDFPVDPAYNCAAANPSLLNSDTGRSHFDDVTCDNTPTIVFRLDDGGLLNDLPGNNATDTPPDQIIPIPFRAGPAQPILPGFAIAIFDEGSVAPAPGNAPGANVRVPLGFATQVEPGLYQFTTPVLNEGSHFITARVQMIDPATPTQTGFGARSVSLEIIVDRTPPPVFFGSPADPNDGLVPDPGVIPQPPFFVDNKTNDQTPDFWGTAEADAIIRVFADTIPANGVLDANDVLLAMTVAIPLDGNNQFPNGQWRLSSNIDLNDPAFFPLDGLRRIFVTAEDLAGNINPGPGIVAQQLEIFLDTQGPQVTSVFITAAPAFDLFNPKPSCEQPVQACGPTPLVPQLSITVRDLPARVVQFQNPALNLIVAVNPGHYQLIGDANGRIPIQTINFIPDPFAVGQPFATGTIVLTFFEPLPDDRFTLILSDHLVDDVGNALDGESNAAQPLEQPTFPSGDGQPGGDFVARFTVDTRPEIATWAAGNVWVDTNGNRIFDPDNHDFVNRDIVYAFGYGAAFPGFAITTDDIFAGNFSLMPGSVADGFDKLGAYGGVGFGATGNYRWLIDVNNDGVPDVNQDDPLRINGLPAAGNFDGNAVNGDEVAVFTGSEWFFDITHDYRLDAGTRLVSQLKGYPIIGDFDGDGRDDLAAWTDDEFTFDLSSVGAGGPIPGLPGLNGLVDARITFGFIGVRELPVAADMDQDGIDDIGLWVPERNGTAPEESAEWYFLISNDPAGVRRTIGTVNTLNHPFEPVPFGKDLYAQYGDLYGIGLVGNFDPPIAGVGGSAAPSVDFTNELNTNDVNGDGFVTPIDVLIIVNALNDRQSSTNPTIRSGQLFGIATGPNYLDPNGDHFVTPGDALKIINFMNARGPLGEGEGSWTNDGSGTVEDTSFNVALTPALKGDLQFSSLVISSSPLSSSASAAELLATSDVTSPHRQQDKASVDILNERRTADQVLADWVEPAAVRNELLTAIGFDELDSDLLDDLAVVDRADEMDQAILELFN